MEGLVVAVHKEEVDKQYVLLKSGGFDPVVMDIDTLAISNAYLETEGVAERETVALLNIGARFTNLAIMHGPQRVFVRDIATGGDMLSRAISEIYGLDLPQAEKRKREAQYTPLDELEGGGEEGMDAAGMGTTMPADGPEMVGDMGGAVGGMGGDTETFEPDGGDEYVLLDGDDSGFSPADATMDGGQTSDGMGGDNFAASGDTHSAMMSSQRVSASRAVLADALGDLISEIQDTFKYYINRRIVPRIDKVRLCGGTAKFPDIDEFFGSQLGVPAQLWNPFARLDVSHVGGRFPPNFLDELGPMMAIATGLAMREI
jgi:type IV pilus assembly protein PilM